MELRKEVKWFASRMEAKLKANDHKGGWHNEYAEYFLSRMTDEFEELVAALETGNTEKSISECADVANFAMMLADNIWRYGVISDGTLTSSAMKKLETRGSTRFRLTSKLTGR